MVLKLFTVAGVVALMVGCAVSTENVDYAAFRTSKSRLIMMLPPLDESSDVGATYDVLSQVTVPLAEAGYYVLPVALMGETFHQNGLNAADDIHGVPVTKLYDIFGADTALYITVTQYGSKYMVVSSSTVMSADVKLVNLKSEQMLQTDHASTSNNEGGNNSGGGPIGVLVSTAVNQIIANVTDQDYKTAGTTSARLPSAERPGGLLYGPRSPRYGTD